MPKLVRKEGKLNVFEWDIPNEEGEYQLFGFIGETFLFSSLYVFTKREIREESEAEIKILEDLRQKVLFDKKYQSIYGKSDEENDGADERKKSSKCCLLI